MSEIIQQILNKSVISGSFGIEFTLENETFDPTKTPAYLNWSNLPALVAQASLGDQGCDERSGIWQCDIRYPENTSMQQHWSMFTRINSHYAPGKNFTQGNTTVRIISVSPSPTVIGGGWASLPVTIEYQSYTARLPR